MSTPNNRPVRPKQGRMIAGVAAAFADLLGIDVSIIRILLLVSLFFGGLGFFLYVAAWVLLPEEGETQAPAERMFGK